MRREDSLRVPGRYDQVRVICAFVADAASMVGFDQDAVFRLSLACDEAATNIIEHAYGAEESGDIRVSWRFTNGEFTVTLHDSGRPFDPQNVDEPPPPDPDNIADLQVGGLGMHIMRQIMDEVRYRFDNQKGNTLVMTKRLRRDGPS